MNILGWSRERLRARLALLVLVLGLVMGLHALVPGHARALTVDCPDPTQCSTDGGGGGSGTGGGTSGTGGGTSDTGGGTSDTGGGTTGTGGGTSDTGGGTSDTGGGTSDTGGGTSDTGGGTSDTGGGTSDTGGQTSGDQSSGNSDPAMNATVDTGDGLDSGTTYVTWRLLDGVETPIYRTVWPNGDVEVTATPPACRALDEALQQLENVDGGLTWYLTLTDYQNCRQRENAKLPDPRNGPPRQDVAPPPGPVVQHASQVSTVAGAHGAMRLVIKAHWQAAVAPVPHRPAHAKAPRKRHPKKRSS